jgi:hypothetical protein
MILIFANLAIKKLSVENKFGKIFGCTVYVRQLCHRLTEKHYELRPKLDNERKGETLETTRAPIVSY